MAQSGLALLILLPQLSFPRVRVAGKATPDHSDIPVTALLIYGGVHSGGFLLHRCCLPWGASDKHIEELGGQSKAKLTARVSDFFISTLGRFFWQHFLRVLIYLKPQRSRKNSKSSPGRTLGLCGGHCHNPGLSSSSSLLAPVACSVFAVELPVEAVQTAPFQSSYSGPFCQTMDIHVAFLTFGYRERVLEG